MTPQEIQTIKNRYGIIGSSPALNHDIEVAVQVAKTRLSVLVTGENGSGKDTFARIIHDFSSRKHGPFFAINCGAIPEGTIASELFGHVKGAFTDAKGDHKGYFEISDGGTLFLDEVGELPESAQVQLLRVLESGEFVRVGDSKVLKTNVRVVAATNRNLPHDILENRFRQDLYYRLNGIEIQIPPLRERKEDIPLLFRKFVSDFSEQNSMPGVRLTEDAKQLLQNYYWAGNIRQLRNVTEHVCLMEASREINAQTLRQYLPDNELNRTPAIVGHAAPHQAGGEGISEENMSMVYQLIHTLRTEIEDLRQEVNTMRQSHATMMQAPIQTAQPVGSELPHREMETVHSTEHGYIGHVTNREAYEAVDEVSEEEQSASLDEIERRSIIQSLERNHGSRKMAAAELEISERTLYRKIKQYGL